MNAIELRAAVSLAFVYVMRMLGLFMVIPVIAIAAVEYKDYSALLIGVAIGGYGLTQAILQIPMGILSDKWGRKPVIYLGLVFFMIGSLIAASADSMWLLVIGRVMQGMGAIAGAVMALAADVTRESQRTKIMAVIGISIGSSFYIALLLGPVIASHLSLAAIFAFTAVAAGLCVPVIAFGVQSPISNVASGDALPTTHGIKKLLSHPQLLRLNFSVLLIHLLITSFFVQIPILLLGADFMLNEHWMIYTPVLLLSVFCMALLMRISQTHKRKWVLFVATLMMGGAFVTFWSVPLFSVSAHWLLILLAGVVFFGGFNYIEANLPAMVSSIAPAGSKGSAMGIYASFQFSGAFIGGVSTGIINQWFEPTQVFIFCLFIVALLAYISIGMHRVEKTQRFTVAIPNTLDTTDRHNMASVEHAIRSIEGIQEVSFDLSNNALYLKVGYAQFNIMSVHDVLNSASQKN